MPLAARSLLEPLDEGATRCRTASSTCFSSASATPPARSWPRRSCAEIGERQVPGLLGRHQALFRAEPVRAGGAGAATATTSRGCARRTSAEFQGPDAPPLDFVFTLCDAAANEECPPWPGQPITAHWGMPDPVKATGDRRREGARLRGHLRRAAPAALGLRRRCPSTTLDRISLQRRLDAHRTGHARPRADRRDPTPTLNRPRT